MGIYYGDRIYKLRIVELNPDPDAFNSFTTVAEIDTDSWTANEFVQRLDDFLAANLSPSNVAALKQQSWETTRDFYKLPFHLDQYCEQFSTLEPNSKSYFGWQNSAIYYKDIVFAVERRPQSFGH